MEKFYILEQIGDGEYSRVYRAKRKSNGEVVVVKKVREEKWSRREIASMRTIGNHPNLVELKESYPCDSGVLLVIENCQFDLRFLIQNPDYRFEKSDVQSIMIQVFNGLEFIHGKEFIHRDIKPENLFFTENGVLKIGDFGLCRRLEFGGASTPQMVTLWYRPIEILLGATWHRLSIDSWTAGCVMAEVFRGKPLFDGVSEIDMINQIISILGTPTVSDWPELEYLPVYGCVSFREQPENKLAENAGSADVISIDLIQKLVKYEPKKRISAREAKKHKFFENASPILNMDKISSILNR